MMHRAFGLIKCYIMQQLQLGLWFDVSGNAWLVSITEVTQRRARLILGWATVCANRQAVSVRRLTTN